ncbi:hypothetical protein TWF694_010014 [Orbilia ellipsospora]|uniref:Uncharacterized protein n=1 Tax=Orbilia ellipsospora TaxID=2528407 RepID=A0AAV9X9M4_9PEZI
MNFVANDRYSPSHADEKAEAQTGNLARISVTTVAADTSPYLPDSRKTMPTLCSPTYPNL